MPTTIEELQAAIQDNISQANSILFLNQNILEEYEERQRKVVLFHIVVVFSSDYYNAISDIKIILQIETLTTSLQANEKELRSCLAETDALKVREI